MSCNWAAIYLLQHSGSYLSTFTQLGFYLSTFTQLGFYLSAFTQLSFYLSTFTQLGFYLSTFTLCLALIYLHSHTGSYLPTFTHWLLLTYIHTLAPYETSVATFRLLFVPIVLRRLTLPSLHSSSCNIFTYLYLMSLAYILCPFVFASINTSQLRT
jgi:hypothetical protein